MGFFIAFLSSASIYLEWIGVSNPFINTILALLTLYLWFIADKISWVWSGFFIGLLWFWWMGISFIHYQIAWAIPFVLIVISFIYALLLLVLVVNATKPFFPSRLTFTSQNYYSIYIMDQGKSDVGDLVSMLQFYNPNIVHYHYLITAGKYYDRSQIKITTRLVTGAIS